MMGNPLFVSQQRQLSQEKGIDRLLGSGRIKNPHHQMQMTRSVYESIRTTVGRLPAECGGVLGGMREAGIITHYRFDHTALNSPVTYTPDYQTTNVVLKTEWNPVGVNFMGFVHSHPRGIQRPSGGDLVYARRILAHIPALDLMWMPIVFSSATTGRFELLPYVFVRDRFGGHLERATLALLDHAPVTVATPGVGRAGEVRPANYKSPQPSVAPLLDTDASGSPHRLVAPLYEFSPIGDTFKRVQGAYDLARLARCRLVVVGAGGAAAFVEDMARAGVGEFILIDPDVVSETNLATQQVYRRDIGRSKVTCIEERITDINPAAIVLGLEQSLDEFTDEEISILAIDPFADGLSVPVCTILCGFTDNFYAQARVNRLALRLGLPSLSAQVYWEGRGAEIVFTYPGITPACQRCILSKRYKAFLEDGYRNAVTSDGTPIFATTRLNAIKGFIALAMLHHGSTHPRWGGMLERIGNRNLVQIRMDPDIVTTLGLRSFEKSLGGAAQERLFFDETVWLPQKPENPTNGYDPCPDCGGTGNLWDARGQLLQTNIEQPAIV